jgi:hypothetical protein
MDFKHGGDRSPKGFAHRGASSPQRGSGTLNSQPAQGRKSHRVKRLSGFVPFPAPFLSSDTLTTRGRIAEFLSGSF